MSSAGPNAAPIAPGIRTLLSAAALLSFAACAAQRGDAGVRIVHHTPNEFCRGTARSIAVERYDMKRNGVPLKRAQEENAGVAVIDAITNEIYSGNFKSEAQAADAGTAACLRYFR